MSRMISELHKEVTTIIIAHRLSTVRQVDSVVYLHDGCVQATGTFEEVLKQVPSFAEQARLMGVS